MAWIICECGLGDLLPLVVEWFGLLRVVLWRLESMKGVNVVVGRGLLMAVGRGLCGCVTRSRSDRGCLDLLCRGGASESLRLGCLYGVGRKGVRCVKIGSCLAATFW